MEVRTLDTTDPSGRVDCYVRTSSLTDPVDETLTTIRELVEDGTIAESTVHSWPSTVTLSEGTDHADVVDTFRTFEAWAEQRGVSIEPAFSVEARTSEITDDRREVLVTPVLCLAVSAAGALRDVFPHRAGETTATVEDGLTALARGEIPTNTEFRRPATASDDHCPWCGAPVVTGQGLYACRECEWVGSAIGPGGHRQYRSRLSKIARVESRTIRSRGQ